MKYRRRQQEVTAVQFVDGRYGEAIDFCAGLDVTFSFEAAEGRPASRTVSGATLAGAPVNNGDWIVKAEDGFSVFTHTDFEAEFEAA